jgi:hypothetical protein
VGRGFLSPSLIFAALSEGRATLVLSIKVAAQLKSGVECALSMGPKACPQRIFCPLRTLH